ncbi:MAG TPA: Clp1/GlmU family protein [Actinomycetota bacterium]|nr:Clp1/GlmU family protein [Actinomycetota bacterium]
MKIEFDDAYEPLLERAGTVVLLGSMGTGKTRFAVDLVEKARARGMDPAIVDCDIDQSTVGPPTTVGLKRITDDVPLSQETLWEADELAFVGALNPRGHLLPLVSGVARLVRRARESGCRLVVVDTTGFVSGIYGQWLNYYVMDAALPDSVVGFERGGELEPLIGVAQRFTPAEVLELDVSNRMNIPSIEDRMETREKHFAAYFGAHASRWRVKPTVFMPTLPPDFDLSQLDGLVVGMENGAGTCVGIGILEYDATESILRMVSPVTEGVRGLRLGSVKIDVTGHQRGTVNLPELFGSE